MEFNSLVLQMKKWRFGGAKLLQYHTVVGGRVKIWVHLCWILKSGVFSTSGYIQNWKISISYRCTRPWPSGLGGLDGKRYRALYCGQPHNCGQGHLRSLVHAADEVMSVASHSHFLSLGQQNVIGRICTLPKERGLCRANIPRWYHNPKTSRCEKFFYGGCNGNGNNFFKKELCEKACNNTWLPSKNTTLPGMRIALGQ